MKYVFHSEFSNLPQTQSAAKALNQQYYYTGKPCMRGHMSARYTSSGNCRDCIAEKRGKVEMNFRGKSSKRSAENQLLAEKALSKGHNTYHALLPCPNGHTERYITTNNCVECGKVADKKRKQADKWRRIKKIYGLSKDEYFALLFSQLSKCAICGTDVSEKNHIDHCHSTGKVRGILCSKCNQGIGLFCESVDLMQSAIAYIKEKS